MKTDNFIRVVLATLIIGLLFVSCSNDGLDHIDTKGQNEGEYGYLSFALINRSVSGITKAEGDPVYGTADENRVNSVLILLYDGDEATSVVSEQILLTHIGDPSAPGEDMQSISPETGATTYCSKAQKVEKADYKLAVFVNPPAALKWVTRKGNKLRDLLKAATVTVDELTQRTVDDVTTTDHFLMGNFAGLVDVKEADIQNSEEKAVEAPVEIDVERAVAKVSLTLNETSTTLDAVLGEIKWDVDVINKKSFWMRQAALMLDGEGGTTDEEATAANRKRMYATDPNMSGQSRRGDKTKEISTEFHYKSGPIALSFLPSTTANPVATYVTENTMDADEQWEDVTTSVLISAVLTPKKSFFGQTLNEGAAYFLYRDRVFTFTDIQEIHAAYADGTVEIRSIGEIWDDLIALEANADIIALPTILEGIREDFSDYISAPATSKEVYHAFGTVRYFAAGAPNYYVVPIRHFSDKLQPKAMAYGRYGVVRNSWYELIVNSINNYGSAEVPKPEDRPDPDDKEAIWLSIEFKILPWMKREQDIGL